MLPAGYTMMQACRDGDLRYVSENISDIMVSFDYEYPFDVAAAHGHVKILRKIHDYALEGALTEKGIRYFSANILSKLMRDFGFQARKSFKFITQTIAGGNILNNGLFDISDIELWALGKRQPRYINTVNTLRLSLSNSNDHMQEPYIDSDFYHAKYFGDE